MGYSKVKRFYKSGQNALTANGRFGVMAAVTPQTILCGNERLYPAGTVVEAATTPSRWDVSSKSWDSAAGKRRQDL